MDIFFSLRLCVLSPRGLWEGPIANPDESYWMRGCLTERDLEISTMTKPRPTRVVQPWKKRGKIGYNYRRKFGLPSVNRNDICRMLVISPNFWTTFWYQIIDIKKKHKGGSVCGMLIKKRLSQYDMKDIFFSWTTLVFSYSFRHSIPVYSTNAYIRTSTCTRSIGLYFSKRDFACLNSSLAFMFFLYQT